MPTLIFLLLIWFAPLSVAPLNPKISYYVLLLIFISTFIIPLISVYVLKATANISSYAMPERDERVVPFLFISVFYGLTTYMFIKYHEFNSTITVLLASITLIIFISAIISIFWKVSIHSIGISGLVGFLLAINYKFPDNRLLLPLVISICFAGIIMSARLYLNTHKLDEVLGGSIIGFLICFSAGYFFL